MLIIFKVRLQGQDGISAGNLDHRRLKVRKDEVHFVHFAVRKHTSRIVGNLLGGFVGWLLAESFPFPHDVVAVVQQSQTGLLSYSNERGLFLSTKLDGRVLDYVAVIGTGKTLIGTDHNIGRPVQRPPFKERVLYRIQMGQDGRITDGFLKEALELPCKGQARRGSLLGLMHTGRRDHLHGTGNFPMLLTLFMWALIPLVLAMIIHSL